VTLSREQVSWSLWLLWVAATALGNAFGAAAYHWQARMPSLFGHIVIWAVVLTLPALLQWLVLRRWLQRAGWWIPASAFGSCLGWMPLAWGIAVGDTQGQTTFAKFAVPASFVLSGALAGTVEALVLRRWTARAGWWVLARGIGSLGAIYVFASLTRGADVCFFLGGLASGALSGAIAGLALVLLLRNPKKNELSARMAPETEANDRSA
jgi:hypothetical protein